MAPIEKDSTYSKAERNAIIMLLLHLCALLLCMNFDRYGYADDTAPVIFVLAVFLTGFFTDGYLWSLLGSMLSVFVVNYFFTPPYSQLSFSGPGYPVTFVTLFVVGILTSTMTVRARDRQRLQAENESLYVLSETNLGDVIECVYEERPDVLIVDSIQTLYDEELNSPAGSVGQVKNCTMKLMQLAKEGNVTVFVIGHVNKDGFIAGPKVLEHMVDCVLYFEGEQHMAYRILRAAKNRFGATNEIGVFEMMDCGLREVEKPSEMLLSGRPEDAPGSCVTCVMEGARPVLAEIQALIAPSNANYPRRTCNGLDTNRASMLLAVLEKRGKLKVSQCDAFFNIIGGLTLDEPAADLATLVAIASSYLDKPIPAKLAAVGEVGLSGEVRSISHAQQRLGEVQRLGFTKCIIPAQQLDKLRTPKDLQLIPVKNVGQVLQLLVHDAL